MYAVPPFFANFVKSPINGYESFSYDTGKEQNLDGVYVLFNTGPENMVQSILLTYNPENEREYGFQKMIVENGKPDMILWGGGGSPYVRFLFWLNRGLGISVHIRPKPRTGGIVRNFDEVFLDEVIFFSPMDKKTFEEKEWLCCSFEGKILWSRENLFPRGTTDIPDTYSPDPFDWHGLFGFTD